MSETPSYPALIELISRLEGKDQKTCELALYCLKKADERDKRLRAENEKLRAALSDIYEITSRAGHLVDAVKRAAAAALKEKGDE